MPHTPTRVAPASRRRFALAWLFCGLAYSGLSLAQPAPAPTPANANPTGEVTVVVEVSLPARTAPAEALAALNDMRAMIKTQPGFLSETLFQNLNADNSPHFLHVSRWATMAYWAAVFNSPQFNRLNAHSNEHYRVSTSAFQAAE